MTTIVVSPYNVASFPEAGGHFWVYMQGVAALQSLGIDVYWMEQVSQTDDRKQMSFVAKNFIEIMRRFGYEKNVLLYTIDNSPHNLRFLTIDSDEAQAIIDRADLLINYHYSIDPDLLSRFRKTALIDIDPGLLQFWMAHEQLSIPAHDFYFTTGETVGTTRALFPDCGLKWIYVRPGVFLDLWPYVYDNKSEAFTTVSSWWGKEYISDGNDLLYENNKRVTFLKFLELAGRTRQPLELALSFGDDEEQERKNLEQHGWRVRHAFHVARGPEAYRKYIQESRGEFSCAKPSCMYFQNAWISDRTLCYLATGKPAVVQHTGPSSLLPNGEGLFRFETIDEAVRAFDQINSDYERHCRAARSIAEEYFDARKSIKMILETTL